MDSKSKKLTKRNVGLQTVVVTKEYVLPSVAVQHNLESIEYPKFITIPHNIIAIGVTCSILLYLSFTSNGTFEDNAKRGIIGAVIAFLSFGIIYLPDSMLRRPHPIFWRIIQSLAILYLIFITFILFLNRDQARQFLSFFDDKLGVPLPEKNYADKCDLSSPSFPYINLDNFTDSLDFYLTAHLIGWYIKMLILRDFKFCWFLSIFFEILELTFRHWLPNFYECWWDHLILDVFGCNALGIWLGDITIKFVEMKGYRWAVVKQPKESKKEEKAKFTNTLSYLNKYVKYFTPNYWNRHEWNIFSSLKRFYSVIWFILIMNLIDLSHFFLKYILWLPANHWLLFIRINIMAYLCVISAREYYEYITNKNCTRLYQNVFIAHIIVFVECAIVYKYRDGLFVAPFPDHVKYFWGVVFVLISAISVHLFIKEMFKKCEKENKIDLTDPTVDVEEVN
jgi:phosphatidylserine synthase 2